MAMHDQEPHAAHAWLAEAAQADALGHHNTALHCQAVAMQMVDRMRVCIAIMDDDNDAHDIDA
jgi:hypothetical protein